MQNGTLWSSYSAKRQGLLHRSGARDDYERTWLFHGTAEDTVYRYTHIHDARHVCMYTCVYIGHVMYGPAEDTCFIVSHLCVYI